VDGNNERLLTPGEVAALFRVDPKTVTRWAASGRITSIRTPGGHRRFRESEVRALLRGESEVSPEGHPAALRRTTLAPTPPPRPPPPAPPRRPLGCALWAAFLLGPQLVSGESRELKELTLQVGVSGAPLRATLLHFVQCQRLLRQAGVVGVLWPDLDIGVANDAGMTVVADRRLWDLEVPIR
jgi:excisionase family DNA binding protein